MTHEGYARPELLTSTDWLAEHLDDSGVRVVDCDEFEPYLRAHIKNAVGIRVHHYIKHPEYPSNSREYPLVAEPDVMKAVMEDMGIGDDTLVVAYDNSGSLYSTRFWWVLNYYGHTNVKVLDGGWKKWVDEGRPLSIDRPPDVGTSPSPQRRTTRWYAPWTTEWRTSETPTPSSWTSGRTKSGTARTTGTTRGRAVFRARCIWNG